MTTQPPRADAFRDVLRFLSGHWRRQPALLGAILLAVLGAAAADVLLPFFAGALVDALAAPDRAQGLAGALAALGAMVGLGAVMLALRGLAMLGIVRFTLKVMTSLAADAFWRVQRLSTEWHASSFAGSTVRKVTRGMGAVDALHDTVFIALIPTLAVLVVATIALGLQWPLMGAIVALGALLQLGLVLSLSLGVVAPAARLANAWDTRLGGALADAVSCNAVVKAFGAEAREDARLAALLARWRGRTRRFWLRGVAADVAQGAALLVLRLGLIGGALWLWWRGEASPGDATTLIATYFVIQGYLRDIGYHTHALQRAVNEMEELVALHRVPLAVADRPGAQPLQVTAGAVRFEAVGFRYGGHVTPLFADLNVTIRPGERIGLVGPSGSGKTTFVKLLQRLHDPTAGRITIDGQDIALARQDSLRAAVAVVQQEPLLFHRSLAENIAYGRPGASAAEIAHAARLANAHDFIARLPRGYATEVGERGVKLSGGERQRVALARAFLADARILVLDEATSSLDSEAEALIQEAMARLAAGRTTITIAHRLSTVRDVDRILVFERGRIVEEGGHAELLARPGGRYRRLVELQAEGLERAA
jgi:ATP-binding cassette subfamily B protein